MYSARCAARERAETVMSRLTIFLGRLIGLSLLIISLAMLIQREAFVEAVGELIHHRPTMLVLGMLTLIAGLAMVLGHNVWSGGALPIMVTIVGWITLIRSVVLLSYRRRPWIVRSRQSVSRNSITSFSPFRSCSACT